ncbi:MAG: hypothetical protein IJH34_12510 [Romboutsia sp.]|nr:hypothetical protein [Romboutsia sp.]
MENYILEAFQKLRLIEDDFDLSADRDVVDELKSFVADDIEEIPDEPIIDVTAEDEEDLADNYIGKVILECTCCHSRIYKDEADVVIDEESELANIDEECPVCGTAMGYTVIGKIEKFDDDVDFEDADEEEEVELELEDNPAEEEPVESLRDRIAKKRLQEAKKDDVCPHCGKNPCVCEDKCNEELSDLASEDSEKLVDPEEDPILEESIENISVDTEDTHLEMSTKEDGGVEIETTPLVEDEFELTDDTELEVEEPEAEEIVPLTDEEQADIIDNEEETLDDIAAAAEEELPAEGEEELPIPDEFEETEEETEEEEEELPEESLKATGKAVNEEVEGETDIDDFDEESFEDLAESYLRRVYENVNTFKTTAVKDSGDTVVVEGIIKFKNNKAMKSSFVFTEATETKTGKVVLEGYNTTFSKALKSFRLRGSLKNNNYVSESLSYNYTVRNLTEGKIDRTKVCGRVKR